MRDFAFKALLWLPTRLLAVAGFFIMLYATIRPAEVALVWDGMFRPEQVRLWALVVLVLILLYWVCYLLLRSSDQTAVENGEQGTKIGSQFSASSSVDSFDDDDGKRRIETYTRGVDGLARALSVGLNDRIDLEDEPKAIQGASGEKPAAEQTVELEPDLTLKEVARRVRDHLKLKPKNPDENVRDIRRINLEIGDKIYARNLSVWGRFADFPLKPIPNYRMGSVVIDIAGNCLRLPTDWKSQTYTDVHFCKAEIDRVWPS